MHAAIHEEIRSDLEKHATIHQEILSDLEKYAAIHKEEVRLDTGNRADIHDGLLVDIQACKDRINMEITTRLSNLETGLAALRSDFQATLRVFGEDLEVGRDRFEQIPDFAKKQRQYSIRCGSVQGDD